MPHALHLVPDQVSLIGEEPIARIQPAQIIAQIHPKFDGYRGIRKPVRLQLVQVLGQRSWMAELKSVGQGGKREGEKPGQQPAFIPQVVAPIRNKQTKTREHDHQLQRAVGIERQRPKNERERQQPAVFQSISEIKKQEQAEHGRAQAGFEGGAGV